MTTENEAQALIERTYLELLRIPNGTARLRLQGVLCDLRNYLAKSTGRDIQEVQEEFEERAITETIYPWDMR